MNLDDQEAILKVIRLEAIPAEILAEYEIRKKMFGRMGCSNEMSAEAVVDLIRGAGFTPVDNTTKTTAVDWRGIARGTEVEAEVGGRWQHGVYLGLGTDGKLDVRLDGNDWVHECRQKFVRLAPERSLIEDAPVAPAQAVQEFASNEAPMTPHTFAPAESATAVVDAVAAPAIIDWSTLKVGELVYVDDGDDFVEATYQGELYEAEVAVQLLGESKPISIRKEKVFPA